MIPLYYDLHIHSCLSPCGDDDMTPANLVGMAAIKGLDVIALTDHNSCANCPAAVYHGENYGVTVIPGMELTTEEEVHVICLFSSLENGSQEILLALFYSGGERRVTGNIYSPFPETYMLQLFWPPGVEGRQHAPVLQGGMAQDAAVAAVEGGVIPKACADGGFLGA